MWYNRKKKYEAAAAQEIKEKNLKKRSPQARFKSVLALSLISILMFTTVYGLILNAITIDKDTAKTEPGLSIEEEGENPAEEVPGSDEVADVEETLPETTAPEENTDPVVAGGDIIEETSGEAVAESEDTDLIESGDEETLDPEAIVDGETTDVADAEDSDAVTGDENDNEAGDEDEIVAGDETTAEGETVVADDENAETQDGDDTVAAAGDEETTGEEAADTTEAIVDSDEDKETEAEEGFLVGELSFEEAGDYLVTMKISEDAQIPAGAVLAVSELSEEESAKYREQAQSTLEGESLVFARFFDIRIMKDGVEIEPAAPVEVSVQYTQPIEVAEDKLSLLHFHEDEEAAVIDAEVIGGENKVEEVKFEADKFSIFGFVGSEVIEKNYLSSDGETFKVTVNYTPEANIPAEAELEVREISEDSDEYNSYLQLAAEAMNLDVNFDKITFARFFDISIVCNGEKIEPESPVSVTVEYINPLEVPDDHEVVAVHFAETGVEVIDTALDENGTEISFEQASFSVTGTVVTNGNAWPTGSGQQYVVFYQDGDSYYAIAHNKSTTEVSVANGEVVFPNAASLNELTEYWWTYEGAGNDRRVYYTTSGVNYYLDPAAANAGSTTARNLSKTTDGRIYSGNENDSNYLGVSGTSIVGQQTQENSISNIQFANTFLVDTGNHVTVHFVDRDGHALSDVVYTGNYANKVIRNEDGTFTIPYDWNNNNLNQVIDLRDHFHKTGYTYANTHLAGNSGNNALTYGGLTIDAALRERGNHLYFYTDFGHSGNQNDAYDGATLAYGNLPEYDLDNAYNARTTVNGALASYVEAGNKDIYVILDPRGPGAPASGTGGGASAADVDDPTFQKRLENNHDGTYTLSLNVTGKGSSVTTTPKANVMIVLDTSSSMDSNNIGNQTRLVYTQDRLKELAGELLGKNTNGSDTVELALVSFDGGVVEEIGWTTSLADFNAKVDGLVVHRGTDWEDGLKKGYELAKAKKTAEPGETTFVIFFTDGEGSQYSNFHGRGSYGNQGSASYIDSNQSYGYWYSYFLCREAAKDEARAIVNDGIRLYAVYAYNSSTSTYTSYLGDETGELLLHNTVKYGYDTTASLSNSYFFNAQSASDIEAAFRKILVAINASVGFSDVVMNDSITSLTSVGLSTVNGDVSGFTYTRSGGVYGTGQTWTNAPHATYSSTSGVQWNLGNMTLEDGVTYTLSFTVWPSQTAYDWIADLANEAKTWDQAVAQGLDKQIVRIEDSTSRTGYRYELMTNPPSTDDQGHIINNKIEYKKTASETITDLPEGVDTPTADHPVTVTSEDGKTTTTYTLNSDGTYTKTEVISKETCFGPPDKNMGLEDTMLKVRKKWVVDLQIRQLVEYLYDTSTGNPKPIVINFDLYRSDVSGLYKRIPLGWDQNGEGTGFTWADALQPVTITTGETSRTYYVGTVWEKDFDIAIGLMLSRAEALARGLDLTDTVKYRPVTYNGGQYYVLETGHDYHIDEPTVTHELDYRFDFSTEVYHPMLVDGNLKSIKFSDDGNTVTSMTPEGENLTALDGYNTLRGGINLHKIVQDEYGVALPEDSTNEDKFTFTVTLVNDSEIFAGEDIPWYSVNDKYYHDQNGNYGDEGTGMTGNIMTASTDKKSAQATISISRKDQVRIANVPAGTTYTISEADRDGYVFVSASRGVTGTSVYDLTVNAPAAANISGEIVPNKQTDVTFINRQLPTYDVTILKVGESNNILLAGAVFSLYGDDYYLSGDDTETHDDTEGDEIVVVNEPEEPVLNTNAVPLKTGLVSNDQGKFELGKLGDGTYYLVETMAPPGYLLLTSPIVITVNRVDPPMKDGKPLYVTYRQEGNAASYDNSTVTVVQSGTTERPSYSYTLTVINNPGVELPETGGIGRGWFFILGGILIAGAGALLFMRKRNKAA